MRVKAASVTTALRSVPRDALRTRLSASFMPRPMARVSVWAPRATMEVRSRERWTSVSAGLAKSLAEMMISAAKVSAIS